MVGRICLHCLSRVYLGSSIRPQTLNVSSAAIRSFSNKPVLLAASSVKKMAQPKNRQSRNFVPKKKAQEKGSGRKDRREIGELRAKRKRIVLSNTNALAPAHVQEMSLELLSKEESRGKMMYIPMPVLDRLRALEAFKTTQGWALYKRPAVLVLDEIQDLATFMKDCDNKSRRIIMLGGRNSGKSTLLLQALTAAVMQKWTIINFPEGFELTNAHTEYSPVDLDATPTMYTQPVYTAKILDSFEKANAHLAKLQVTFDDKTKELISRIGALADLKPTKVSIAQLARRGADDFLIAVDVFRLLTHQLKLPGRPPILIAMDSFTHIMRRSDYRDKAFNHIHAHQLVLVEWFLSHLNGTAPLPNGGIVIGATSASNNPKAPVLSRFLNQLERGEPLTRDPFDRSDSVMSDCLYPKKDQPHASKDKTTESSTPAESSITSHSIINQSPSIKFTDSKSLELMRLKGTTKAQAATLMEYWARSGMYRAAITDKTIGWMWAMSDGGIIGELERACVRSNDQHPLNLSPTTSTTNISSNAQEIAQVSANSGSAHTSSSLPARPMHQLN